MIEIEKYIAIRGPVLYGFTINHNRHATEPGFRVATDHRRTVDAFAQGINPMDQAVLGWQTLAIVGLYFREHVSLPRSCDNAFKSTTIVTDII